MRKSLLIALAVYCVLTVLGLALVLMVCLTRGDRGLEFLLPRGAWTYSPLILISAAIAWALAGGALLAAWRRPPRHADVYGYAGLFLLGFLYLNLLRERERYYDLNDYFVAARAVHDHQPLPSRYLYPPLLAVALAPMVSLGEAVFTALFVAANFAALLLFYVLLRSVQSWHVRPDGESRSLPAEAACFVLLAVNVPLQRTLFYGQINLHVANLILLGLLWSGRRPALSAAALALGAHLKIIPVVFILPFLFRRDWRWLGWFAFFVVALGVATLWAGGTGIFHDFFNNTRAALAAPPETNFRDNSIDSFLRATAYVLHHLAGMTVSHAAITWLILALKGVLLAGVCLLIFIPHSAFRIPHSKHRLKAELPNSIPAEENYYYRSFVAVSFFMVLLSPVLWEHYPVFLIFPFLALFPWGICSGVLPSGGIPSCGNSGFTIVWLAAWFLIFCVPTFDFYPFSYTRLAGILLLLPLLIRMRNDLNAECGMRNAE